MGCCCSKDTYFEKQENDEGKTYVRHNIYDYFDNPSIIMFPGLTGRI